MYCIYQITNKVNGHKYIGQHKYSNESNPLGKYKGSGVLLHKAYEKYGIENFTFEILYQRIKDKETVNAMEVWAIEKYKPEYNIARGGYLGVEYHTIETRKKMSQSAKGRTPWNKGKTLSEEYKRKISESHKGMKYSEDFRKKCSERQKGKTSTHKGKHMSEDAKRKISDYWTKRRKAKLLEQDCQ